MDKTVSRSERESNFELLRIIAMFMIICFHFALKGGFTTDGFGANQYCKDILLTFGKIGVNVFMLISGYFMVKSKRKVKKVIKLACISVFYTLLGNIVMLLNGAVTSEEFVKSKLIFLIPLYPEIYNIYWFVTTYLIIYILSPYLNIFLNAMDKKTYREFLMVILVIWCIIPTVFWKMFGETGGLFYFNNLIWMVTIYCIGAYYRLYGGAENTGKHKNIYVYSSIVSFLLIMAFILLAEMFPEALKSVLSTIRYFYPTNTIMLTVFSVSLFNIFRLMKLGCRPKLNFIAGTTLGIYMFHDGEWNDILWKFMRSLPYNTGIISVDVVIGAVIVMAAGILVDIVRQGLEKVTVTKILDKAEM